MPEKTQYRLRKKYAIVEISGDGATKIPENWIGSRILQLSYDSMEAAEQAIIETGCCGANYVIVPTLNKEIRRD